MHISHFDSSQLTVIWLKSFCCILCLRFRLELCFQNFTYRTLHHCFQYKVVVHIVIYCLCQNKVTVLFIQNVCGKRYQLNPFSPVFCAKIFTKFFFYPYSISTPPSSFSFQSYFLFFNSFILHFYTSTAVDTCSLRLPIFFFYQCLNFRVFLLLSKIN